MHDITRLLHSSKSVAVKRFRVRGCSFCSINADADNFREITHVISGNAKGKRRKLKAVKAKPPQMLQTCKQYQLIWDSNKYGCGPV